MTPYAAIVLAAGQGARYAAGGGTGPSKLVAAHRGEELVRHAVTAVLASKASPAIVVTGHAQAAVEAALAGLSVTFVHNMSYPDGLSTSLRAGLAVVPPEAPGIVVVLGDMPAVTAAIVDALIGRARACPSAHAVVPTHQGRRGNPVLVSRALFDRLVTLSGDSGARRLLDDPSLAIETVEQPAAVLADIDHPADLEALNGGAARSDRLQGSPPRV